MAPFRRSLSCFAAIFIALCAAGACSSSASSTAPSAGPRALTSDEASRLALIRFNAYRDHVREVSGVVETSAAPVSVRGWVDEVAGKAYALFTVSGGSSFLARWTADRVSAQDYTGAAAPLPEPAQGWEDLPLTQGASDLGDAQIMLLGLSSDRPENAQLLPQSGAQWLRSDVVFGTPVDVFSGPVVQGRTGSSLQYWVDAKGNLLRLEARLDGVHWSRFDFTASSVRL